MEYIKDDSLFLSQQQVIRQKYYRKKNPKVPFNTNFDNKLAEFDVDHAKEHKIRVGYAQKMLESLVLKNETNLDKIFAVENYLFIKETKEFISGTLAASLKQSMKSQTKKYKKSKGGVQTFEALLDAYRARLNAI